MRHATLLTLLLTVLLSGAARAQHNEIREGNSARMISPPFTDLDRHTGVTPAQIWLWLDIPAGQWGSDVVHLLASPAHFVAADLSSAATCSAAYTAEKTIAQRQQDKINLAWATEAAATCTAAGSGCTCLITRLANTVFRIAPAAGDLTAKATMSWCWGTCGPYEWGGQVVDVLILRRPVDVVTPTPGS